MKKNNPGVLISLFLAMVLLFIASGCAPDHEPVVDPDEDPVEVNEEEVPEPVNDEIEVEDPEPAENYFWPWLSHGQLVLSSTEVIDGSHLFESDTGFVGEFTRGTDYSGRIVWLVKQTDVFEIEWVALTFDVDYYALHEREFELNFMFEIEDLDPEPEDKGDQVFKVDLAEEQEGFRVVIDRVILGKEQEGSFTTDPIDYVALEIELRVVDKP